MLQLMILSKRLKQTNTKILFPIFNSNPHSWKIIAFSDAAHANLTDGVSSAGAHVIFLVDNHLTVVHLLGNPKN